MQVHRIAFWLLASAGVAVGHIVGYVVAHPDRAAREAALTGHAYLSPVATVLVPLAVTAALVWAVRTARDVGASISMPRLASAQVGLFLVQENAERLVDGVAPGDLLGALVGERGIWFGLLAQVLVADLVVRSIGRVRRFVARCVSGTDRRTSGRLRRALAPTLVHIVAFHLLARLVPLRGPPVVGIA